MKTKKMKIKKRKRRVNITTKITRWSMAQAKRTNPDHPKFKEFTDKQKERGMIELHNIIAKMEKMIVSICSRAYVRFSHYRDRAMTMDDLISIIKENLVYGIYRYSRNGKLEPLNYLLGVIHITLRNVHNYRNRQKRIPLTSLVSMDTPNPEGNTLGMYMANNYSGSKKTARLIDKCDIEVALKWNEKKFNKVENHVFSMVMGGMNVYAIARACDLEVAKARKIIRKVIKVITKE